MASLVAVLFLTLHCASTAAAAAHKASPAVSGEPGFQLRAAGNVIVDMQPTVLDLSNFTDSVLQGLGFGGEGKKAQAQVRTNNPKNGTPWFRYTKAASAGVASHAHLEGLLATGDFKIDILESHNVVRDRVGLSKLTWSKGLEDLASRRVQKLAHNGCYIRHSPLDERWYVAGFNYVGENLYKVVNMVPTGVDIGDAWYAEIEDYTYGTVGQPCVRDKCAHRESPPCMIGHFTQMMWQPTTHVGCAMEECPNQKKRTFISVCNYGPGGNLAGKQPFHWETSKKLGFGAEICELLPRSGSAPTSPTPPVLLMAALVLMSAAIAHDAAAL